MSVVTRGIVGSEYVEVETVLRLVGDGVLDPGQVLPVLPGHLPQGLCLVGEVGGELLRAGGSVTDGL